MTINEKLFCEYCINHKDKETSNYFDIPLSSVYRYKKLLKVPRKTFRYKELPDINERQKEILIGSLLGDGSLSAIKWQNKNSAFIEVHGIQQFDYLQWKYNELKPFSLSIKTTEKFARKINHNKVENDYTRKIMSCRFNTVVHPLLTELENKWYLRNNGEYTFNSRGHRIKCIPNDLILTPLILAIWYFDDGSDNSKKRNIVMNTQGFTFNECEHLITLLSNIGIVHCSINKNRNKPIIKIKTKSYIDFIDLVSPHLPCESMKYKVDKIQYTEPDLSTQYQPSINEETAFKIIEMAKTGESTNVIAKQFKVTKSVVDRIRYNLTWKNLSNKRYVCTPHKNKYGVTGGIRKKRKKFEVSISVCSKKIYLGTYNDLDKAIKIREFSEQMKENKIYDPEKYKELISITPL